MASWTQLGSFLECLQDVTVKFMVDSDNNLCKSSKAFLLFAKNSRGNNHIPSLQNKNTFILPSSFPILKQTACFIYCLTPWCPTQHSLSKVTVKNLGFILLLICCHTRYWFRSRVILHTGNRILCIPCCILFSSLSTVSELVPCNTGNPWTARLVKTT